MFQNLEIGKTNLDNSLAMLKSPVNQVSTTPSSNNKHEEDHIQALLSSGAYAFCSVSMVLINKFIALSVAPEFRHHIPNLAVVWIQCMVAVVSLEILRAFSIIDYSQLQWNIVKQWLPVNIIFILMLTTGFMSFLYLSVPMINIMKNLTNVITIFGDWGLYGEKYEFRINYFLLIIA